MVTQRPVLVMEMPSHLTSAEARVFLQDLEPLLESPRPRIVFDCSEIREIDKAGVAMLLHGLEEAMKREGDLKLAGLPPESEEAAELKLVFDAFTNPAEAVRSFNVLSAGLRKEPCYTTDHSRNLEQAS